MQRYFVMTFKASQARITEMRKRETEIAKTDTAIDLFMCCQ